jgi:hypothetical protein
MVKFNKLLSIIIFLRIIYIIHTFKHVQNIILVVILRIPFPKNRHMDIMSNLKLQKKNMKIDNVFDFTLLQYNSKL